MVGAKELHANMTINAKARNMGLSELEILIRASVESCRYMTLQMSIGFPVMQVDFLKSTCITGQLFVNDGRFESDHGQVFSKTNRSYPWLTGLVTMICIQRGVGLSPLPIIHSRETVCEPAASNTMVLMPLSLPSC